MGVPVADGRPLVPPEVARLPAEERAELERRAGELNERIGALMRDLRRLALVVAEPSAVLHDARDRGAIEVSQLRRPYRHCRGLRWRGDDLRSARGPQ